MSTLSRRPRAERCALALALALHGVTGRIGGRAESRDGLVER
jgi:hypothetical protein